MDVQVYENLSEEAKDRLYLETLKRTVNISGGKKDPETLRREAICEALDSLVETSPMPAAKVFENTDSQEQNETSGFARGEKNSVRGTGLRGVRGRGGRGANVFKGEAKEKGKLILQARTGSNAEECLTREQANETNIIEHDSKPMSRGRGLKRRGRAGRGGLSRQNLS